MTLLNGLLAFGATAFVIPLFIHLLNRNRFQIVDWGAMQLLQSSRNLNSRRMQWKQLLLLVLRCALPVLLALAMARPLLHSFLSADGQSALSLAIVLDDSLSMFVSEPNQDGAVSATRFALACQSASELLDQLPAGSNATLILGGSMPESIREQAPDLLAIKIREIGKRLVPAGDFILDEAIRPSLQWLSTSLNSRRQLVLISDFQKHEWSEMRGGQLSDVAKLVSSQAVPPVLSFLRIGQNRESNTPDPVNLSIHSIEVSPGLLAIERESTICVTIGNHGVTKSDSVPVAFLINEVEIERQQVVIDANSTTQFRVHWSPKQMGEYIVQAKILSDDVLNADNALSTVAIVQNPIPILLVDGDMKKEPMQSEADFLRLGLSPFALLGGQKGDAFSSSTISPEQLNEASLKGFRAVCLCNVSDLSESQQISLHDFIEKGGGLLVFLGDQVKTERYQRWRTLGNAGLRISTFSPREITSVDIRTPQSEHGMSEVESNPSSRAHMQQIEFTPLREMSSASLNSLASVRFAHRNPMQLDADSLSNLADASVALRFEDGQPLMLEARIGKGRCLWMSVSCDDDDSNLPTRSIFVPLVQKLAAYVCNVDAPNRHSVANGHWLRSSSDSNAKSLAPMQELRITKPDGVAVTVQVSEDGQLRFNDTRLLGTYVARQASAISGAPKVDAPTVSSMDQFAICIRSESAYSGDESTLSTLTRDELKKLANYGKATVSYSVKEFLSQTRSDWHGREAWTWLWIALIICFLAEMALEQKLSPRLKRSPAKLVRHFPKGNAA